MSRKATAWLLTSLFLVVANPALAHGQAVGDYLRTNPKFVQTFREIVQPHAASVVRIQCDDKDTCLGIVVGEDGWILAKAHELAGKITCKLHDGRVLEAKVIGVHEPNDLALLQIAAKSLRVLPLADSKSAKAGAWVASVGLGQDPAAIGVVSVPTRKVSEAFLGVLADTAPLGLVILDIGKDSAAFKAGLKPRDIILTMNQRKVADPDQFQQMLGEHNPGDTITFKIKRGDLEQTVKAILQSREQENDFRTEFQNRMGSDLSKRRTGYVLVLQHDSVLKPSDCGGPLVDLQGRVIGINISRSGRVESLALPAEILRPLIAELMLGKLAPKEK